MSDFNIDAGWHTVEFVDSSKVSPEGRVIHKGLCTAVCYTGSQFIQGIYVQGINSDLKHGHIDPHNHRGDENNPIENPPLFEVVNLFSGGIYPNFKNIYTDRTASVDPKEMHGSLEGLAKNYFNSMKLFAINGRHLKNNDDPNFYSLMNGESSKAKRLLRFCYHDGSQDLSSYENVKNPTIFTLPKPEIVEPGVNYKFHFTRGIKDVPTSKNEQSRIVFY